MKTKRVLFATDFSSVANAALPTAASLVRESGGSLVLVHVEEPPISYGEEESLAQSIQPDREKSLQMLRAINPGVPVEYRLLEGDPAEAVLSTAAKEAVDLIVLGSHGRTGLFRLLMGSVAEQISRAAPCPVLICKWLPSAKEASGSLGTKILFPTDFSASSLQALELATSVARDRKATLVIAHVQKFPLEWAGGEMYYNLLTAEQAEARRQLAEVEPTSRDVAYEHRFQAGDPADGILKIAEEEDAALIVMATHGRTGLTRVLMGSVAESVVRRARCPVLMISAAAIPSELALQGEANA